MIAVIDYGLGNLASVHNMLRKLGVEAVVSSEPAVIRKATKLILPGVGSFDTGMRNLQQRDLIGLLNELVMERQTPILGICLGTQLLTRSSEEGVLPGLGWVDAETVRFRFDESDKLRVPHMGWNELRVRQPHPLLDHFVESPRFYFVHSYYLKCHDERNVLASARHGAEFPAVIWRDNIVGTQFHPEKSHKFGLRLLRNFAELA